MKQPLHFIAFSALALLLQSCSWFDVGTKSDIEADEMYRSADGYYTALTGLYVNLGDNKLYGANLPLLALEPLSQQYAISDNEPDRVAWAKFNYQTDAGETIVAQLWLTMYNTIVNANLLLSQFGSRASSLLSPDIANVLHGEALALRAYMYFDLLRLYSPAMSVAPDAKRVPLKTDFGFSLGKQVTTAVLLDSLAADLATARTLLRKDPLLTGQPSTDKYLSYARSRRMNYYAATALLARLELYRAHYDRAAAYAREVIQSSKFRFITAAEVLQTDAYGAEKRVDRVFMPEMIFALNNEAVLSASRTYYEGLTHDFVKSVNAYQEGDVRLHWYFRNPSAGNKINLIRYQRSSLATDSYKYDDPVTPLLKLSEMYLIATECALHGVEAGRRATDWLNALKTARGETTMAATASTEEIAAEITREYIRDFRGEGQLFYYYKRLNLKAVDDGNANGNTVSIGEGDYTLPLPPYEKQFGYGQ